ncbi:MAG: beta-lactamase family protein [Bacteroidetes bacterium]|uniref:Beta-lactamase family protein n=1 Tax=Candidatus Cryptobacteroides avicola TaxID=2840757 RepID=A0A940DQ38_9BACT|nr:beta-lactamase family protein [Candidatus Cryptobacteroides avicola]
MEKFLKQWEIKGASLSVMRNDSLVYSKGYGWADQEAGEPMTPGKILRMASVSKLITATGIMMLKERDLLTLQDKVFGPDGILNDSLFTASIRYKTMYSITVEQLLRHQGGFTNSRGDPMFSTRDIIRQFRLDGPPDHNTLVSCVLKRPLGYRPGSWQRYSNFGYLLLSMIIEKISGQDYETFIQENVLHPAGCYDMHLANNYYEQKYPNEVRYYMHAGSEKVQEYNMSGRLVERCYGGNDIHALSGAGAWCGSTAELCRFVASIDGRPEVPDILSYPSISEMTEYFDPQTYSLGWNDTRPDKEWTRTGTLTGTSALVKYFPDGECWIMITNTSTWRGPGFTKYTERLFKKCRELYSPLLPHRDMFGS